MFDFKERFTQIGGNIQAVLFSLITIYFLFLYTFNIDISIKFFSFYLIISFLICFFRKNEKYWCVPLLVFSFISFLTVSLSYYLFDRLSIIPEGGPYSTYRRIIELYMLIIPLSFLPTILHSFKYKADNFFSAISLVVIFSSLYVFYYNVELDFSRGPLSSFFNPIISYDISFIALGLLVFVYSFYLKSKQSYLLLIFSLFFIFNLIFHGSRGTWIALPVIFLLIIFSYFKAERKKIALTIGALLVFLATNVFMSNSPIISRVGHFQADKQKIEKNSYQNSTGIRLLLWDNALDMFEKEPVLGVSLYGVEAENCKRARETNIPQCFQHAHNIFFNELAAHGVVGIIGLLISLLLPLIFFILNAFRSGDAQLKFLGLAGSIFVIHHIASGLTEYYLFFRNATFIYYFMVTVLMSFIYLRQQELKRSMAAGVDHG